jgi:PKD repeat protein
VGFLYNDTTPGFPTITVSAIGLVSASQTESIVLPIGVITTSVPKSLVGQTVYFNATASFDPDGESIMNYSWSFGDQSPTVTGNSTFRVYSHVYLYAGNFTVTLTVIDNNGSNGASNSTTILFRVDRPSIRIVSATLSTTTGTVGDTITMTVDVLNDGTISETFTVSMDANNLTVAFKTVTLTPGQSENVQLTWNTLGYSSGAFTIKARVLGATVPIAQSPLENAGQVTLASQNTFIGSITFWIIIGIVVAAAAVVTILLRRRRTIPTV